LLPILAASANIPNPDDPNADALSLAVFFTKSIVLSTPTVAAAFTTPAIAPVLLFL
jgi:hypothetical protein